MNKIDEAIAKITREMMADNNPSIQRIEEYLTSKCTTDEVADKLLGEDKNLNDCLKTIKNKAHKMAISGMAMVEDSEVFSWVDEYYGIPASNPDQEVIDIMSLF